MATTTKNYKQTSHLPRVIYTEPAPLSGMNYTNTPLQPGYAKIVYNLVENPEGTGLRARPGAVYKNEIELPADSPIQRLVYKPDSDSYVMSVSAYVDDNKMPYNYNRYTLEHVVSENTEIIHCIYSKNNETCFYYNSTFGDKEPYIIGQPLTINDYENKLLNKYNTSPIYNTYNKLVYTKGFETNDLIVLCKTTKCFIKTKDIENLNTQPWFIKYSSIYNEGQAVTENAKLNGTGAVITKYNKISKDAEKNVIYTNIPYSYEARAYDYQENFSQTVTELEIPDVLEKFYDIMYEYGDSSTPFGFRYLDSDGNTIEVFTVLANSQYKFKWYFENIKKAPISFYRLPSKISKSYNIESNDFNINITDIKINYPNLDSIKYKIHTSSGTIIDKTSDWNTLLLLSDDILENSGYKYFFKKEIDPKTTTINFNDSIIFASGTESYYTDSKISETVNNITKLYDHRKHLFLYKNNNQYTYIPIKGTYDTDISDDYYYQRKPIITNIDSDNIIINIAFYIKLLRSYIKDNLTNISEINLPDININIYLGDISDAPSAITPKEVSVKEALLYGYNMLLSDPYKFEGTLDSSLSENIQFDGLLTYDSNDDLVLNPVQNINYKFKVIAHTGTSNTPACMLVDYKTMAQDVWNKIETDFGIPNETLTISDFSGQKNKDIVFNWTPNVTNAIIRIRFYAKTEKNLYNKSYATEEDLKTALSKITDNSLDGTIFEITSRSVPIYYKATYNSTDGYTIAIVYYPEAESEEESNLFAQGYRHILTAPITLSFERNYESNSSIKNYDFSTAQGITYWYNRLIVWGVDSGSNILFFSDINDPSYFPYPNNISVFDEPVIKAVPFQDNLLVFTTTKIWKITLSEDGMSWHEECIQKNLRVTPEEAHLIKPLTNMVFFKSGLYYYLLTPSSKGTGELVIANISKPITDILEKPILFFNELESKIYNINRYIIMGQVEDFLLQETNVYLDSEEIHIVYTFASSMFNDSKVEEATSDTLPIPTLRNYILSYNINTRKWRVWSFDSDTTPKVLYNDAIKGAVWYVLSSRLFNSSKSNPIPDSYIANYNKAYTFQFIFNDITDILYNRTNDDYKIPGGHNFYQYLDTGNRDIRKEYYKKFREYQVTFNNRSNNDLTFYIEFSLDDNPIIPLYSGYVESTSSPDVIYNLNREAIPTIYGTVYALQQGLVYTVEGTMWDLFHMLKCKSPITSKGYYPSLHILSKNSYSYDILDITWVYRLKNAR